VRVETEPYILDAIDVVCSPDLSGLDADFSDECFRNFAPFDQVGAIPVIRVFSYVKCGLPLPNLESIQGIFELSQFVVIRYIELNNDPFDILTFFDTEETVNELALLPDLIYLDVLYTNITAAQLLAAFGNRSDIRVIGDSYDQFPEE